MHSSKGYSCQATLSIYNQIALNGLQEIKYSGNESGLDSKLVVNTAVRVANGRKATAYPAFFGSSGINN